MPTVGPTGTQLPLDPLGQAAGVLFESFDPRLCNAAMAPATQAVRMTALYATAGTTLTGVKIRNNVAAAGTLPTTARFGLADNTGKMLIESANLNALANWGTGVCPMPFTATFTLAYSGVYYPCFVVNGTWGTTQPTPINCGGGGGAAAYAADGSNPALAAVWNAQTDLPAVGSSLTMQLSSLSYWMGVY